MVQVTRDPTALIIKSPHLHRNYIWKYESAAGSGREQCTKKERWCKWVKALVCLLKKISYCVRRKLNKNDDCLESFVSPAVGEFLLCALHFRATITVKQYCFYHVSETVLCKFLKEEKYCAGVLRELKSVSLVVSLCAAAGLHRVTAFQPGTEPVEGNLRWLFPLETRPGLWHAHTSISTQNPRCSPHSSRRHEERAQENALCRILCFSTIFWV